MNETERVKDGELGQKNVSHVIDSSRRKTERFTDPFQLLADCNSSQIAGCLRISSQAVVWNIHLGNGCIKHASTSIQMLNLSHYFRSSGLEAADRALKTDAQFRLEFAAVMDGEGNESIAQALNWLERREHLNFPQAAQVATNVSREALESFFWLTEGEYSWLPSADTDITCEPALAIETLLPEFQQRLRAWQMFGAKLNSPYQRPYLVTTENLPPILSKLAKFLRGLSIYQLAFALKQDSLKVAQLLYPHIRNGELILREPKDPHDRLPTIPLNATAAKSKGNATTAKPTGDKPPTVEQSSSKQRTFKIACIDDSPTILDEMQNFLGADEYEVTKIDDPVKAPSVLFRLRPDLILMDITMPEINGYKLCSLLRSSTVLANTPIVMVTGRTGLIDKARAKVTGATDYLTKPFTRGSLLAVVEQHLKK